MERNKTEKQTRINKPRGNTTSLVQQMVDRDVEVNRAGSMGLGWQEALVADREGREEVVFVFLFGFRSWQQIKNK